MNFLGYVIGMLLILRQGPEQEEDGYLEFSQDPEERIATAACALARNDENDGRFVNRPYGREEACA